MGPDFMYIYILAGADMWAVIGGVTPEHVQSYQLPLN